MDAEVTPEEKTVSWADEIWQAGFEMVPTMVTFNNKLSALAFRTYVMLIYYAREKNEAWPGQIGLAEHLGVTDRTIRDALKELSDVKLLKIKRRGFGLTNLYTLLAPRSEAHFRSRTEKSSGQERKPASGEVDLIEVEKEELRSSSDAGGNQRAPNLPFEALATVCDGVSRTADVGPLTAALKEIRIRLKDEWTDNPALQPILAQIAAAGETKWNNQPFADEIIRRAALYRQVYPEMVLTPTALAKNWSRVLVAPVTNNGKPQRCRIGENPHMRTVSQLRERCGCPDCEELARTLMSDEATPYLIRDNELWKRQ